MGIVLGVSLHFFVGASLSLAAGSAPEPEPQPASSSSGSSAGAAGVADVQAKVQSLLDATKYTAALNEVELGLKEHPLDAVLHKQKGFALRQMGKYREAVASYLEALKIKPDLHQAKEYLAVTYLKMGETKPARQLLTELKSEAPDLARMLESEAQKMKIKW